MYDRLMLLDFINLLMFGKSWQKRHRIHRDTLIENTSNQLHCAFKNSPLKAVNFREIFQYELFGFAMKQVSDFEHFLPNSSSQFHMLKKGIARL